MSTICPDCKTIGSNEDEGTTCRTCTRGIMENNSDAVFDIPNTPAYDDEYFFVLAADHHLADSISSSEEFDEENENLTLWEPFEHYPVDEVAGFVSSVAHSMKRIHEDAYALGMAAGKAEVCRYCGQAQNEDVMGTLDTEGNNT
jgi:hypothetical protein